MEVMIEANTANTHVAVFSDGHIGNQCKRAREEKKPLLWFNGRIWIVTVDSCIETTSNSYNLPTDLVSYYRSLEV